MIYDLQDMDHCLKAIDIVQKNSQYFSPKTLKWAKDWKAMYDEINNDRTGHGDFTGLDYYFNAHDFEEMIARDLKDISHTELGTTASRKRAYAGKDVELTKTFEWQEGSFEYTVYVDRKYLDRVSVPVNKASRDNSEFLDILTQHKLLNKGSHEYRWLASCLISGELSVGEDYLIDVDPEYLTMDNDNDWIKWEVTLDDGYLDTKSPTAKKANNGNEDNKQNFLSSLDKLAQYAGEGFNKYFRSIIKDSDNYYYDNVAQISYHYIGQHQKELVEGIQRLKRDLSNER